MTGQRRVAVGIDTGGTFTDAVAVELGTGALLSKAKAPTTHDDLARGVRGALLGLDARLFGGVELVSLSTTLATNAVVEGKGLAVGLIVAAPDPATFDLPPDLPAAKVGVVAGAHAPDGSVVTPLDVEAAADMVARMAPSVDAFAVSAYFSVANREHELEVKRLVAEHSKAPVVCGHELSQRIGMLQRATTAALNARLLPLVRDLLDAVRETLTACGITAPLMVVKGDGSLTAERVARERPVETVLSGPAASVVGACHLSGLTQALVADMGGTTTDIAAVAGSMPQVSADGALVGGWRTRVRALDVRTVGLGGDSHVRVSSEGTIVVGPERVIPLCVAAQRFPQVVDALAALAAGTTGPAGPPVEPVFLTLVRVPRRGVSPSVAALLDALEGSAVPVAEALTLAGPFTDVEALVRASDIAKIGFTPTDLLHVTGEIGFGDPQAARLGLEALAALARTDPASLLGAARTASVGRLTLEVAARALAEDLPGAKPSPEAVRTLEHLLEGGCDNVLGSRFTLGVPLLAVGAPAGAWFPEVAARLGAPLVVPPHAEVANAFGALAGRVLERAEVRVKAEPDETFVVVAPETREAFLDYRGARARAEELAASAASYLAAVAGAADAIVTLTFDEVVAGQADSGAAIVAELTVVATATGPPLLERDPVLGVLA